MCGLMFESCDSRKNEEDRRYRIRRKNQEFCINSLFKKHNLFKKVSKGPAFCAINTNSNDLMCFNHAIRIKKKLY